MSGWSPADLLPGLYVILLVAGLAAALRRWYDPVPLRVLALFVLVPFLLFPRALVGGDVLLPVSNLRAFVPFRSLPPPDTPNLGLQGDLIHQIAPWQLEVRRALADGRWPLWNANGGAGMPLLGDPQSQLLQPLVTIAYPFAIWEAAGVTAALRVLMAMLFLFLLLRRQGLGEAASALGGLAYGLAGFLQLFLGWPVANAASLLPLGLYAVVKVDESGRSRDLFLLFLAVTGLFLGGHPETVLYAVLMVGVFLLARVVRRFSARDRPWPLLIRGGLAMALAGLAAAPVLLPVLEYLPGTQRAAVVNYHMLPRPLFELWETLQKPETLAFWQQRTERWLLHIAAARAYGDHQFYWGTGNVIEDAGGFAGSVTLLLALVALIPWRGWRGRTRFLEERLMAGLLVLGVLLIAQPPGFENLFFRLPILGVTAIHRHHRILLLVPLAMAYLAACEAERWRRGEGRRWPVAVLAAALGGLIAWGYLAHPHPEIGHLLAERRNGWMGTQLAALAVGAGLLLVRAGDRRERRGRVLAWLLVAVAAAELFAIHGGSNLVSPRRMAYPVTPPIRFLQENLGNARMMGLGSSALPANFHLVYGLNDVRIDNPSLPYPYARVLSLVSRQSISPNLGRPGHPVYDLLGVRYVMTRPGIPLPPPLRLVFRHPDGWIYERPNPLPRLFLPARGHIFEGGSWQDWLGANPNFAVRALVQSTDERNRNWRARAPKASKLEIVSIEPEHIQARALLKERRLLATSIFQDGNWRLLVDREPHPSILTNGPFFAAWLQAGERRIDLVYRPRRFVLGMVLCGLAMAMAAAWLVPPPSSRLRGR